MMNLSDLFPMFFFLAIIAAFIVFTVLYFKAFYAGRAKRQENVEEQRKRHGGEYVLEWNGPLAQGEADQEFGKLVVAIPKKRGNGNARFYEKGVIVDQKRVPYSEVKDIVYLKGRPGKKYTLKAAMRDSAVMWIYRKKGSTIGIRDFSYQFDEQTMEHIRIGLGY